MNEGKDRINRWRWAHKSSKQITIVFAAHDVTLAYYLKSVLKFGAVFQIKNKKTFIVKNKEGLY